MNGPAASASRSPTSAALTLLVLWAVLGCGSEREPTAPREAQPLPSEEAPPEWEAVSVFEAQARLAAGSEDRIELISKRSMQAEVLRWRAEAPPDSFTALHSVAYYVLEGAGGLLVGADTIPLVEGSAVFVRGREQRAILGADDDLFVLALYASGRPALSDPAWSSFSGAELVETKDANRNVLHRVLAASTMTLGTMMLPRELSGDLLARHGFDEMKFVMFGTGSIDAGADIIPVEVGWLVYIDGTLPHRFFRISRDLDVLFVWGS